MKNATKNAATWFAPGDANSTSDAARATRALERCAVVFSTPLGWLGFVWSAGRVERSTFAHASAADAQHGLGVTLAGARGAWREIAADAVAPRDARAVERLVARLRDYAEHFDDDFADVPLAVDEHTDFQRRVLAACRTIRPGETLTYAQLAQLAGAPGSARAVGNVMATNRFAPLVPCHRVVGSGGGLGGYSAPAGLSLKRRLIAEEARRAPTADEAIANA